MASWGMEMQMSGPSPRQSTPSQTARSPPYTAEQSTQLQCLLLETKSTPGVGEPLLTAASNHSMSGVFNIQISPPRQELVCDYAWLPYGSLTVETSPI